MLFSIKKGRVEGILLCKNPTPLPEPYLESELIDRRDDNNLSTRLPFSRVAKLYYGEEGFLSHVSL